MINENDDVQTSSQLNVLSEVSIIFEELNTDFWLRGGWAIDFLLGRITRQHSDVDIVTWIEIRKYLEYALLNAGYDQLPVKEQFRRRQSDFCKDNVEIALSYLTYNGDGSLILNGLPQWEWREESLLMNNYLLDGIYAKVIHPKQLLEEKKTYQRIGRPYRKKDAESKKVLKEIISKFR